MEGGVSKEDQELLKIEQLSQQLVSTFIAYYNSLLQESLYKEMEQMRRENLLFESYIKRNEQR